MVGMIVIKTLVSCDSLHGITVVKVIVRVCHTVPTSFVLATALLGAYWRLTYYLEGFPQSRFSDVSVFVKISTIEYLYVILVESTAWRKNIVNGEKGMNSYK